MFAGYQNGLEAWFFKVKTKQCDKFPDNEVLLDITESAKKKKAAAATTKKALAKAAAAAKKRVP